MNFLKKLFGIKKEVKSEPEVMTPDEFYETLLIENEKVENDSTVAFKKYENDLKTALNSLEESNVQLTDAKVTGTFDIRVVKRAKSNRENVKKQVDILVNKLKPPEEPSLNNIFEFNESSIASINSCLENMGRSFYYTKAVFPAESDKVSSDLKSVGDLINEINNEISVFRKKYNRNNIAISAVEELNKKTDSEQNEQALIDKKRNEIEKLNEELKNLEKRIEDYYESEDGKEITLLKKETEQLKEEEKVAFDNIKALVLPLFGNISAIVKLHESKRYGVDPEFKKRLEKIENDIDTNLEYLNADFFSKLKEIFKDENLDIQDHKKEKAYENCEFAEKQIGIRTDKYKNIQKEIEQKQNKIKNFNIDEINKSVKEKEEILLKIKQIENECEESIRKKDAISKQRNEAKSDLEKIINSFEKKIEIKF
ncbi:MAG: hypothetical protein GX362_01500 [Methanosarcinaceae archaeon]|nr:hypothetical protein [Methanosarcinaceae archaeon]